MSAVISSDGLYRYQLRRDWADLANPERRVAVFVMLNPSTADATKDDSTIRRCIGFAATLGCAGLEVVNVYAWRATKPAELWRAADPVGPDNDSYLSAAAWWAQATDSPLIVAWGAHAKPDRVAQVMEIECFDRAVCLGTTQAGAPRHPLYLRGDSTPTPWRAAA